MLGELGELSFEMYKLGKGKLSFGTFKLANVSVEIKLGELWNIVVG